MLNNDIKLLSVFGDYIINIVTKKPDNLINNVDEYFNLNLDLKKLSDVALKAILEVDKSSIIDINSGIIRTPYGITSIKNLSMSCKAVIVYICLKENGVSNIVLNITECGANALDILFDYVKYFHDSESVFYLGHEDNVIVCKDRVYNINGNICENLREGLVYYG